MSLRPKKKVLITKDKLISIRRYFRKGNKYFAQGCSSEAEACLFEKFVIMNCPNLITCINQNEFKQFFCWIISEEGFHAWTNMKLKEEEREKVRKEEESYLKNIIVSINKETDEEVSEETLYW